MPKIDPNLLIPPSPLHWTSILHYIILVGALYILITSQSDISLPFIILLTVLAVAAGGSLYAGKIPGIPAFLIFMLRTAVVGIPFTVAGITRQEEVRSVAIVLGVLGVLLFISMLIPCTPLIGDPRLSGWCVNAPG
jgi:hypothetical protein